MEKAPLVTLDAAYTKDVDDAFSYARNEDGHLLTVAIANAAAHVKQGSAIDLAAQKRAATIYAGTYARESMLPRGISEAQGSLVEGVPRKALIFRIQLDADLNVIGFTPSDEIVTVTKRLHYEDIGTLLKTPENPFFRVTQAATGLAQGLLAARRKQGALAFYDLTRMLASSEEGAAVKYRSSGETLGHIVVQEFMILTNRLVAQYLLEHNIPGIFRNHEAKVSSPPSNELAYSLEAWIAGDVDVDVLQQKVNLIAARAEYSPLTMGHYGLTLPAYTHSTSPLRRYPDLVVQRQLLAHLSGKPYPYSPEALAALCTTLNATLLEQDEARSDAYKAAVRRKAERALDNGRFTRLKDHELIKAIELTSADGSLPEELALELAQKFESGDMTDKLAYAFLNETLCLDLPGSLKTALAAWLNFVPQRATNYLNHAAQNGILSGLPFDTVSTAQGYASSARLVCPRKEARPEDISQTGFGNSKKTAEQQCAMKLIFALLNIPVPGTSLPDSPVVAPTNGPANAKNRLLELCQARKWPAPAFEATQSGPSHIPRFDCRITLKTPAGEFEGTADGHPTRKVAEFAAAESLLSRLTGTSLPAGSIPVDSTTQGADKNPISSLQEWLQKRKRALPTYAFSPNVNGGFVCELTVPGFPEPFRAIAASKQEAKFVAADKAFNALG